MRRPRGGEEDGID